MSIRRDLLMRSALLSMTETAPPRATASAAMRLDPPAPRRDPRRTPARPAGPAKSRAGSGN